MTLESFTASVALIGIVILVSSLLSGVVERTGVPQVAIFLLLGAVLGPTGLGVFDLALDSPALRVIATLALMLVLFGDAISLDLGELRRNVWLVLLVLGPGTLIPAALIAVAAWYILGLHWAAAAIIGAALASTDPVLLRVLVRRPDVAADARLALRFESGMNDVVLLPIVVISMLFLRGAGAEAGEASHAGRLALGLFVLGPGAGVLTGLVAITLLDRVRRKVGVRRDYESLYALGVAFTAFAAAEAVEGSGFVAAFAAGMMIAALDVELCDCFLDYGAATAEMFLLLTFVAFGASLIWTGLDVISARTVVFAIIALSIRTVVFYPVLATSGLDRHGRRLVAWAGPRGLSTLLLVLIPVFAGIPGSDEWFSICSLVVLMSVVLHGGAIGSLVRRRAVDADAAGRAMAAGATVQVPPAPLPGPVAGTISPERREPFATSVSGARGSASHQAELPERITLAEMQALEAAGTPITLLDVRTQRTYESDPFIARGAIRMPPDDAVRLATERRIPWKATLVAYCA